MSRSLIISIIVVTFLYILFFPKDGFPVKNEPVKSTPNIAASTSKRFSTGREKKQFLDQVFIELQNKQGIQSEFFQGSNDLYSNLAQLAIDSDERVSETTLTIISMMALAHWANSMEELSITNSVTQSATSGIQDISQSNEVKNALEQLIKEPDIDDDIRGRSIEAHSYLYPPQPDVIKEFEKLIIEGGDKNGDTLTAVFMAFTNYKAKYNYEIPTSVLEATMSLTDHPSDSVETAALHTLRENVGMPILPFLLYKLETTRNGAVENSLVMDILALDQSDDTLLKLREIASRTRSGDKAYIIQYYSSPKNIEQLRAREKKKKSQ